MTENVSSEIEPDSFQRLPLRLVDGHGVTQFDGELVTVEGNSTRSHLNFEANTGDFNNRRLVGQNFDIYDTFGNPSNYTSLTINEAAVEVYISDEKNQSSNF